MTEPFRVRAGRAPMLVSMPHVGTEVPPDIASRLSPAAKPLPDTDWHVDRLYDFLDDLGVSVLTARYSRYVVDLNRPSDNKPLYPGASNTGLCPVTTFDDAPIYLDGGEPDAAEIDDRREVYWRPYHARLQAELAAIRERHGIAVLWDAHSIRSQVPRFFEGRLPDLNLGTAGDTSAAPALLSAVEDVARAAKGYSWISNGRFQGGAITRSYGAPAKGIHAVQLELSQITYMNEDAPYGFRDDLASGLRPVLRRMIEAALSWARADN
jgi:N-formylglutamate deformylase